MDLIVKTGELATFSYSAVGKGESWCPNGFAENIDCSLDWSWQTSERAQATLLLEHLVLVSFRNRRMMNQRAMHDRTD